MVAELTQRIWHYFTQEEYLREDRFPALGGDVENEAGSVYIRLNTSARPQIVRLPLGQAAGNGGVFSWQNPESQVITILRVVVRIEGAQAGQTLGIGLASSAGGAHSNLIIDALSLANAGTFDNITNKGAGGATAIGMTVAGGGFDWLTGTASGTPSSLTGFVYIEYLLRT